jgi:hypothetical protein
MLDMPNYWNSKYYDRETNTLSAKAPQALKDEFQRYNMELETSKENYRVY